MTGCACSFAARYRRTRAWKWSSAISAIPKRVIVRPGQVFGPGAPALTGAVAQRVGKRLVILGSCRLVVPLVYVADVVDAILLAAKQEAGLWHIVDAANITQAQLAPTAIKLPY